MKASPVERLRIRLAVALSGLWVFAAGIPAILIMLNPPALVLNFSLASQRVVLAGFLILDLFIGAVLAWLLAGRFTAPIRQLLMSTRRLVEGQLSSPIQLPGRDELAQLAETIGVLAAQLRSQTDLQERRTLKHTAALQTQIDYLQALADISLEVSLIQDSDLLARRAAQLILERLNLYFVGLFRLDPTGEWAVLKAGTGEIGEQLLARGHRIPAGQMLPGMKLGAKDGRISAQAARDGGRPESRLWLHDITAARSEISLPLRAGERMFGALVIQSARAEAFDEELRLILQKLAAVIAAAWENARQFTESREALEASRRASRAASRQAWQELAIQRPVWGYRYSQENLEPVQPTWQPDLSEAARSGQSVLVRGGSKTVLSIPILVRGESIGAIRLTKKDPNASWQQEEIMVLETVATQVGQAVESARLYQDTQSRALQEELTGTIAARIRESLDLDTVLQTAVREVGQALALDEVSVILSAGEISVNDPS